MTDRIRLMDEFGPRWPVWVEGEGPFERPEWGLPEDLRHRLFEWALEFHQHFEVLVGWDDPARFRAHLAAGKVLARELQQRVGSSGRVELHVLENG